MYINLMVHFLYSLQLCLQFSFIATCYYNGSQHGTNYTVDMWNISAIDTLNFTKSTAKSNASKVLRTEQHEVSNCKYIWMEEPQSMLLGPVLQCQPLHYHYRMNVTCTSSGGKVCRNAGSTSWDNDRECV